MKKLTLFSLTAAGIAATGMMAANAGPVAQVTPQEQVVAPQQAHQLPIKIMQEIKNGSAQLIGSQIAVNQIDSHMVTRYTKIYRLPDGKLAKLTTTTHSIIRPMQQRTVPMKPMMMRSTMPMNQHSMQRSFDTMQQNMTRMMNHPMQMKSGDNMWPMHATHATWQPMQMSMSPMAMMNSMQRAMQQNLAQMMYMNPMSRMPLMPVIHIKLVAPQYNNITHSSIRVPAPHHRSMMMNSSKKLCGPTIGGFINTKLPNTKIKFLNEVLPGTKIKLRTHIVKEINPVLYQIKDGKYTTYVVIPAVAWQFQTITPTMTVELFGTVKQLPNGRNIVVVHRVYHN